MAASFALHRVCDGDIARDRYWSHEAYMQKVAHDFTKYKCVKRLLSRTTKGSRPRGCQFTRPVVKNLSAPLQKDHQGSNPISGGSLSPSQLTRTLVNFPLTTSPSSGSSGV